MSEYNNFIKDYPDRCHELLRLGFLARMIGRDVTLMLAIASTGINIPYERLKEPRNGRPDHPSNDRAKYTKAKDSFDKLLKEKFCGSVLWEINPGSWNFGALASIAGDPDVWPELRINNPLPPNMTVEKVLNHLRNAMAHGCIFTQTGSPIKEIIFLSSKTYGSTDYNYILVSPADFKKFLYNWFEFTKGLDLT